MTQKLEKELALSMEKTIHAPVVKVYQAWTEPKAFEQWFGAPKCNCKILDWNFQVGGKIHLAGEYKPGYKVEHPDGGSWEATMEFSEIIPNEKLVILWLEEEMFNPTHPTKVTVEFRQNGNATQVFLTHERFSNQSGLESATEGWTGCLNGLEQALAQ